MTEGVETRSEALTEVQCPVLVPEGSRDDLLGLSFPPASEWERLAHSGEFVFILTHYPLPSSGLSLGSRPRNWAFYLVLGGMSAPRPRNPTGEVTKAARAQGDGVEPPGLLAFIHRQERGPVCGGLAQRPEEWKGQRPSLTRSFPPTLGLHAPACLQT